MTRLHGLAAFCLTFAFAGACAAPAPPAPEFRAPDQEHVVGMFSQTVADFRAGAFENWASRFSDDAVLHAPNQPAIVGRPAILAWAQAMPPIESIEFTNVRVWGAGDVAWGVSDYTLALQGVPPDTGKQLAVVRRTNGEWHVVAVSFNTDLPLPAAAAAGSAPEN